MTSGESRQGEAEQIQAEQRLVDAMYGRLDAEVADAITSRHRVLASPTESSQELFARDAEVARLTRVVTELRAAERSLCFGRIDEVTGRSLHIGRVGLRSEEGQPLLVDWRADAARPFYVATPAAPEGLRRRRHLRLDDRRVMAVSDEVLDGSVPTVHDVIGDGPLVAVLESARTGRMREAVATLQVEQDAIVRSSERGVTVVDGGPGTGKTIVALHRTAFVLYAFPAIADRGVLVFGPNRRFLDYISDVLPSLGENDVRLATAGDLVGAEPTETEPDAVARVKGRAALAGALAGWVRGQQPSGVPMEFRVGQDTIVLDASMVDAARRHATQGGVAHHPAREAFKEQVIGDLVNLLEQRTAEELAQLDNEVAALLGGVDLDRAVADDLRRLGLDATASSGRPEIDWDGIRDSLVNDPSVDATIDAVWPHLDAAEVLRRILADHVMLAALAPDLTDDEVALLSPPTAAAYTSADLALLDELRTLIDGPPSQVYGHVVVDEAQELSELQWRMLMRRCPTRSLTIVGDFAQASAATTIRSWSEAIGPFVGERFAHHTLTINYRTTAEILAEAAPLLARIAPDQQVSHSIRHGERPRTVAIVEPEFDQTLHALVLQAEDEHPNELIGVVVPPARVARVSAALAGTAAVVIAAPDVRGLEFDTVFVVDPDGIEAARDGGVRDHYVALTRATKRVVTVDVRGT